MVSVNVRWLVRSDSFILDLAKGPGTRKEKELSVVLLPQIWTELEIVIW